MYSTLHCIALRTVRHTDTTSLLSVWSREAGRLTLAMPASNSREARRRRALTTPLATFECVCRMQPGREVLQVRDLAPCPGTIAYDSNPLKGMTAMFLAEALDLLLRRTDSDPTLSDYLFNAVSAFGRPMRPAAAANFHLVFLFRLATPLGVGPDTTQWQPGMVFDMRDATFRPTPPMHTDYLTPSEAAFAATLARTTFANMHRLVLSHTQRNAILDIILRYYALHLAPLTTLKSLQVLRNF